jgi:predicted dehydrogenase
MSSGAEVAAICDSDPVLLDYLGQLQPDCQLTDHPEEIFNQTPLDAVFICTPPDSHRELAFQAIDNNTHIFIEPPLAESLPEAIKMTGRLKASSQINAVGYTLPFSPVFSEAKKILERHPLENIKRIRATLFHSLLTRPREGWMFDKDRSGGGILMQEASSLMLLLTWFFGPARTAFAKITRKFGEVEDSASIFLEFPAGIQGYVDVSWSRPGYPRPAVNVFVEGTQGVMDICDDSLKLFTYRAAGGYEKGWTTLHQADLPASPYFFLGDEGACQANGNFISACLDGERPRFTWQEGLNIMKQVEAIYLSSRTNSVVSIDEV